MGSLEQAVYAIIISFVVGVILCPVMIPMLHRLKFGQNVRDDGPQSHLQKQGTPTMGGIAFLIAFAVAASFFMKDNLDGTVILLVTVCYGIIGFLDDYIKVVKKRSLGLRAAQKLLLQLIVTGIFCWYIYKSGIGTQVYIPFGNGARIDLGILFIPFLFVTVLGTVNGVNLTDGLDGLAGGVTLIVAAFFAVVAWAAGSTVSPMCGAIVGGLLAFLIFNSYPARVFMGDTGSLALGGFIASTAFILKMPIFILIVGFIYLLESVSTMLQVGYFKLTKRKYGAGKRLFKMAPFHHHLEQSGWRETKVVTLFYVATAMLCLIGFLACKNIF
ncbi:phospho-N-acetylmuramoyl-pentapeptide-transferase [Anaerotignum neopropionicum]|uniref:Phospho-N-acetylmuramoyl-pentapeptide-transferase n=1 Tax=Anaerotignum neopropionicum TaxID=36847 RepID=A0A136WFK7_9FIRM|nr:phospho-N-acetylmuramoyl-pentapeptide-transferase [Anaerotignum neopropionicum]KXL53342.1 phospho-N-acetylmuramoyl-pentapeptide-transferase [Anaerotignum neopropionicum]